MKMRILRVVAWRRKVVSEARRFVDKVVALLFAELLSQWVTVIAAEMLIARNRVALFIAVKINWLSIEHYSINRFIITNLLNELAIV